jgi:hypothetical protein
MPPSPSPSGPLLGHKRIGNCPVLYQLLATAASVAGGVFSSRYISASWRTAQFIHDSKLVAGELTLHAQQALFIAGFVELVDQKAAAVVKPTASPF